MNLNKVILIGRLTRDPEIKSLPSGQQVVSFGMATDRHYQDKSGQKQQKTEFHNIVAFGKLADIAGRYLTKGSLAMIEGRLQTRSWQDNSGQKRSRTEIVAQTLQLGPKSAGRAFGGPGPEAPQKEAIPIVEEEIDINDIPL